MKRNYELERWLEGLKAFEDGYKTIMGASVNVDRRDPFHYVNRQTHNAWLFYRYG